MDDYNPTELRSLAAEFACIQLVHQWASGEMPAIDIWKKEEDDDTCPDHEWFIRQMKEMQLPASPVIPNLVRDQIEYHMTSILKQVTDWIRYHHRKNFFHDDPASPLKEYVLKLIWKPNRSIDYEATAKNVLNSTNFNGMEKYRFACTYCFPEDVRNLKDMAKVAIDWCFEEEPLLVYWSKYLTDQLHTITLPANDSIEEIMFAKALNKYDLWQPIKYFFGKLNSSARLSQCDNVFLHKEGKYQKELLALLNECEKSSVYQANMVQIIQNYYLVLDDFESVRLIYIEMKDKWSFEDLSLIIDETAFWSMVSPRLFNALTPFLIEIWKDVSDEDKRRVISTGLRSRIAKKWNDLIMDHGKYYYNNRNLFRNPMVFICALAEAHEPLNFLQSNFYWLVVWQPAASIIELIDEFQFNAEDVAEL
ncbi:uncharacterized protein LOC135837919 [Planococcus citri]|uniref:uncharacterized protein LOC135837919 n=1 Tax=Planococcus citri TaxID=170843 RepID=UPI0031F824D5